MTPSPEASPHSGVDGEVSMILGRPLGYVIFISPYWVDEDHSQDFVRGF